MSPATRGLRQASANSEDIRQVLRGRKVDVEGSGCVFEVHGYLKPVDNYNL